MMHLSIVIFQKAALAAALSNCSPAAAPPQAQTPAQALLNLHQAAQQLIEDPGGDYEKGCNPDFTYPSDIQAQWDASMSAYGNELSTEERELFPAFASHLNAAITDVEVGYRIETSQPTDAAKASAKAQTGEAPGEVAQCSAAIAFAQGEVGSAPSKPQQGGVGASGANGSAIAGSTSEAALPGSIEWTAALDPLQTYLATEWQRVVNDPANRSWAADDAGNTLTLSLKPGQLPEVVSVSGSRSYVFNSVMQNGRVPVTTFPAGSELESVSIAPTFLVKATPGKMRSRYKYYERDGVFKRYLSTQ